MLKCGQKNKRGKVLISSDENDIKYVLVCLYGWLLLWKFINKACRHDEQLKPNTLFLMHEERRQSGGTESRL